MNPSMGEIRYAIVDDEMPSRVNLREAMRAHGSWLLVAECDSAASARGALTSSPVDVLFLDIQMPRESGLALARELALLAEPPLIVFVTAYSVHAVEAFEVHALDYLLKPLDDVRLAQALERAAAMLAQRQRGPYGAALRDFAQGPPSLNHLALHHLNVRSVGRIERVALAEVLYIRAAGNYVALHTAERELLHRVPLSRLEGLLPPAQFLRVHRSAIIRRDQVAGLSAHGDGSYTAHLHCGAGVPVSERHVDSVRALLDIPPVR